MNEPPGARARVGLTGLTVAEHFRDAEGQDVLLFIDNIFRFTQVSSMAILLFYVQQAMVFLLFSMQMTLVEHSLMCSLICILPTKGLLLLWITLCFALICVQHS